MHNQERFRPVPFEEFSVGKVFPVGPLKLSEQEIIDFGNTYDPLPFHTDKVAAQQSRFGQLVASAPQLFMTIHRHYWIPLFKDTVLAGMEINHWKMHRPVFPNCDYTGKIIIQSIQANQEKGHATVLWIYEFYDPEKNLVQRLEMTILHKMS